MRPPFLKQGDTVAIVSPSGKTAPEFINNGIAVLQSWGLNVKVMPHVYNHFHQFAGSDWERISDMQEAVNHPDVKAIICVRGGYGCSRIVDRIDFSPLLDKPKWLVGFSDITVFHSTLHLLRLETIHGAMLKSFPHGENEVKNALFGTLTGYEIEPHVLNRPGKSTGAIVGGNLTILVNMLKTPSDIATMGKILFIEDLNEQLYHLDRMMTQLRRAGRLEGLTGLLVGQFTGMKDCEIPFGKTAEEIILEAVSDYTYPVCFNFPAGHVTDNRAFYLGRKSNLNVSLSKVVLSFE